MTVFEELKARGLIAQMTNEETIKKMLETEKVTFYIGFDPTADSLHVGHFLQLVVMARLQRAGHRPIALLGGGTTMIGDPTGKTDMRRMLTKEDIAENAANFRRQMQRFVDFGDEKAIMVNNADWILPLNYIEFLREIGVHFSVNRMLTAECFKTRLEKGLTFIEFNYMLLQSYDFLHLNRTYGCTLQLGGDDQWSNIINGADLIRRVDGNAAEGMTFTLLTTSEGKKMGKTEKGAVWLDRDKTSPYEFYQYWRNVQDEDVVKCMKLLTFVPLSEIGEYEKLEGSALNPVKERLAYEITKMVHGEEDAAAAQSAARAVFSSHSADSADMPSTEISADAFTNGEIPIVELLLKCGLVPSKGEGRRLIDQGGLFVNGEKILSAMHTLKPGDFKEGRVILKKGKKTFHRVSLK